MENTQKTFTRAEVEKLANKRFGSCRYRDVIEDAPKTSWKRFVRTFWLNNSNHTEPVWRMFIYKNTGKIYLKDYISNETYSNDPVSKTQWKKDNSKVNARQIPLF